VIQRFALQVIALVAGVTVDAQTDELSRRGIGVTRFAGRRRMRADQRKPVEMILHRAHRNLPALHGVALLAFGAELAAVQVRVAIRAALPDVLKDLVGVTGGARDRRVHSPQRIAGLGIMIELGTRPDRTPTRGGMATSAGNFQRSMRIFDRRRRLRGNCRREKTKRRKQRTGIRRGSSHVCSNAGRIVNWNRRSVMPSTLLLAIL
jgi:hypothetical protein